MEPTQLYIAVSEGVLSSWRAIGVLENLHTDGDIAQLLVTLYDRQKEKEGEERMARCGHCHRPLTLYCNTCQRPLTLYCNTCRRPAHLGLPCLPRSTSPSSPIPSLPSQVLDSSSPLTVPTDVYRSPLSITAADIHHSPPPRSQQLAADVSNVKDEDESDGTLQGDHDSDDGSFDLDTVKTEPSFSVGGYEASAVPPDTSSSLTESSGDKRRKSQRLSGKSDAASEPGKKKKKANVGQFGKATTRKHYDKHQSAENSVRKGVDRKGGKKVKENVFPETQDCVSEKSAENDSDHNIQNETERSCSDESFKPFQKRNPGQRKRKPCASQDLEDGFILPSEERSAAQIHVYDDSFYQNHKIEDEPPKRPGRPKKNSATLAALKSTPERHGRTFNRKNIDTAAAAAYPNGTSSDDEMPSCQAHNVDEHDASAPKKCRTEDEETFGTGKQLIRILVSGQKILPLRTTTGNYAHNFYSYFECVHCKKAFVHKRAFNSHVQTHIEPKVHTCSLCGKGFKRSCDRIKHERRHKFECTVCGKKYTDNNELNKHLKLHTENNGVIKCSGCAFETSDFHEYEKHKSKCTIVQCEVCGVRLKSLFALKFHISAVHENDRPFKCTVCEKSFVLQTNLNSHMKYRHAEGGRAFHCDQCSYRAFDARALSIHQRCVHSNERPFKCTYCPSAFARKFYLVVHLRKHTGEKPHRCTECSQSFAQKPSLTRHRRSHHGLEPTGQREGAQPQTSL